MKSKGIYKTITLHAPIRYNVAEAWRRYSFGNKTIDDKFLGLGGRYEYKESCQAGIMRLSFPKPHMRGLQWFQLTPLGQQILKQLQRKYGRQKPEKYNIHVLIPFKMKLKTS